MQPASPYDLKRAVAMGVGHFWSLPHTQLYSECARLAEAGLLDGAARGGGQATAHLPADAGRGEELDRWRAEPTGELYELRDAGLLKLFFGADARKLAPRQLETHEAKLREYEAQLEECRRIDAPEGTIHALEAGVGHEREYVRFWKRLGR